MQVEGQAPGESTASIAWHAATDVTLYQVKHLFLLVGGNPLPNAVAASLLIAPGGVAHFFQTARSETVERRLATWLKDPDRRPDISPRYTVIDNDPATTRDIVTHALGALDAPGPIALHYTGGTKRMANQVYDALADAVANADPPANLPIQFSYLDAVSRALRIHHADPRDTRPGPGGAALPAIVPVKRLLRLSLMDLVAGLHGWTLQSPYFDDEVVRRVAPLADALCLMHATPEGDEKWGAWVKKEERKGRDDPKGLFRLPGSPDLQHIVDLMRGLLGLPDDVVEFPATCLGDAVGLPRIQDRRKYRKEIIKWLQGGWLEMATAHALLEGRDALGLDDLGVNLRPYRSGGANFEFDVAATRGYQLFAFSCGKTADYYETGEERLSLKLFELCTRARQMGGDEACAALVCRSGRAGDLERQARTEFDLGNEVGWQRIKVFGQDDLADLPAKIAAWIGGVTW